MRGQGSSRGCFYEPSTISTLLWRWHQRTTWIWPTETTWIRRPKDPGELHAQKCAHRMKRRANICQSALRSIHQLHQNKQTGNSLRLAEHTNTKLHTFPARLLTMYYWCTAHTLSTKLQLCRGQRLWWFQWQTRASLTCGPLPRSNVTPSAGRFSSFPCGSPPRAPQDGAAILAHTAGEEGRTGEERRGGLGQGGCRRCAGWLQREDRHKGARMEASASRYVGSFFFFFLKGNTTRFVEEGRFGV